MLRISDMRVQEVIDISSGRRLGYIGDVEIDLESGYVNALVVPGEAKLLGLFGKENSIIIPWKDIVKVGADVILVNAKGYNEVGEEYNEW